MANHNNSCILCRGAVADHELQRVQVWEDTHWRLTTSLNAEVLGFSYLEPKRHITDISALGGDEARTLGVVLGRVTSALKALSGAEFIYIYIFGDSIPHLHIHLAPHSDGDALNSQMIRGEFESVVLESGAEQLISREFPPLPKAQQRAFAEQLQARLSER